MQNNERLLKLYESGLPAWAIYMPLYRLPYRPWMRKVHWLLNVTCTSFMDALSRFTCAVNSNSASCDCS